MKHQRMSRRTFGVCCTIAAIAAGIAGCEANGGASGKPQKPVITLPPTELKGNTFLLISLGGTTPTAEPLPTLTFGDDGQVSGTTGVNDFFGPYTLHVGRNGRGELSIGPLGSTRKAGPQALMEQEHNYLDLLSRTTAYEGEGGLLELRAGDAPLLRFRKQRTRPPAP